MGEAQRLNPDEEIRLAREQFESAHDLTLAVEEEFAILDPETLELTNGFERLQAAAQGSPLEQHLVGELISSEVEVRTGRCETFDEAAARLGERRTQLRELADSLGYALASIGTHPWSRWQDQRIIDTPHYRRNDELLRYVVWRNNSFGLHVHVAIRGPDRAVAVCNALRSFLPELLAFSASSPFVEGVFTHLHSARTQIFTRMFPRCGVPDPYDGWDGFERYVRFLYDTSSIDEHTQMWWSVRPHLAFPTVELRVCDAQPDLGESRALVALSYALVARIVGALDEGETLPNRPHRLIEENFWRAIRHGLSGEFIDLETGEVRPTRAHLERLLDWVRPAAEELGFADQLVIPATNSAERQIAAHEQGATMQEIYAALVREKEPVG